MRLAWAGVAIAGITLVELNGPHGTHVFINPSEVASIRQPSVSGHWEPGIRCILVMANGNQIAVTEPCDETRKKLEDAK